MKTKFSLYALSFLILLTTQVPVWAADPTVTQSIGLNPGWNAVYLEVQPDPASPLDVFGALSAGSSVWAWTGKHEPTQFIQDPGEPSIKQPKWLAIFTAAGQSDLSSLYAIKAGTPFLINVPTTAPPLALNITGRPTLRHRGWIPDSFNLTGFSFSATPPTFAAFFASSKSHKDQAIYRLNNLTGAWEMVSNPATAVMRSGEAFWIYCQSGSNYQGPVTVEAENVDGLDFGAGITLLKLMVRNYSDTPRTVTMAQLPSASPVSLGFRSYSSGAITTKPLASNPPISVETPAGGSSTITLAALRRNFTGPAASVLEFTDGLGSMLRVPVTATSNASSSYPGLWSGTATVKQVSQLVDSGPGPDFEPGEAKSTPSEIAMNLILHQDGTGQVRMLKQAIVMNKEPTYTYIGGVRTMSTPGRQVILSNDSLIPNYSGVSQRDGSKVGRRLSAVAVDYSPGPDTDFNGTALKCSDVISGTVFCRIVLESSGTETHPTNPFLHRFHPDHDNLSSDFKTFAPEVKRIEREITFEFSSTPNNPENPPPGWGVTELGGTYTELVRGLAKGPVKVRGDFTLRLASDVAVLNQ